MSRIPPALPQINQQQKTPQQTAMHYRLIRRLVWRGWFESIFAAFLVAICLRIFIVEPLRVPTAAMVPAIQPGDFILSWKTSYGIRLPFGSEPIVGRSPHRGDVIVFRHPQNEAVSLVRRVVGLAGDRIEIQDGVLSVNGQSVDDEKAGTTSTADRRDSTAAEEQSTHRVKAPSIHEGVDFFGPVVIPPEHVFVLGDNRGESEDSRTWGAVPLRQIEGRAFVVWFSVLHGPSGERSVRWERILFPIP